MKKSTRKILVTGADGFIGKNLLVRLNELPEILTKKFVRGNKVSDLPELIGQVDAVFHLAGENRPVEESAFTTSNIELTNEVCNAIRINYEISGRHVPLLFASSTKSLQNNPYGQSKLAAEWAVNKLASETNNPCVIFRLPNVFGKWCKPNYNSVVATFCYNIARGIPIQIDNPLSDLRLVYVDDVITAFLQALESPSKGCFQVKVDPEYTINLGELAKQIQVFNECNTTLKIERVGNGLLRALYATYVSNLPSERFSYKLPQYLDSRGVFVEIIKTNDSGQFSYFTSQPGITRGEHYHHTKSEKFLVIKGEAHFRFRNLITNEMVELKTSGSKPEVVDTIPGWVHDIKNIGNEEMLVLLWANENFEHLKPDTVACKI